MANELHTMPLMVEKLLSSRRVRMLQLDEFGAYIKLLCDAWLDGGALVGLSKMDGSALARLLHCDVKTADRIIENVVKVFFHDDINDTLLDTYNKVLSKVDKHKMNSKKGAEKRWKHHSSTNSPPLVHQCSSNGEPIVEQCYPNAIQNQSQNQSINSSDLEESKSSESNTYFSSDLEASNSEPEKVGLPPIVLVLDPIGFDGIEQSDIDGWTFAFPAVDLNREGVRAAIWCRDNGAKGKKKNYRRFLTNWFSRCQERGGSK